MSSTSKIGFAMVAVVFIIMAIDVLRRKWKYDRLLRQQRLTPRREMGNNDQ